MWLVCVNIQNMPWRNARNAVVVTCTKRNMEQITRSFEESSMGMTLDFCRVDVQFAIRRMAHFNMGENLNSRQYSLKDGSPLTTAGMTTRGFFKGTGRIFTSRKPLKFLALLSTALVLQLRTSLFVACTHHRLRLAPTLFGPDLARR